MNPAINGQIIIPKVALDPMEQLGLDIGQFAGIKYLICVGKLGKRQDIQHQGGHQAPPGLVQDL